MVRLPSPTHRPPALYGNLQPPASASPRRRDPQTSDDLRTRDISPSVIFRAFTEDNWTPPSNSEDYSILNCIFTASVSEKDLGARVAKAAQKLRTWCKEIEGWSWPGTYMPPLQSPAEKGSEKNVAQGPDAASKQEHWGSLPSLICQEHEHRLRNILQELDELDVEELKAHIQTIYGPNRSQHTTGVRKTQHVPLNDFEIIVTKTLLRSLPYHALLNQLISDWSARLCVLRRVPSLLGALIKTKEALRSGWTVIRTPFDPESSEEDFCKWKEAIYTIKNVLGSQVGTSGQQLDRILDILEGHDDVIPDEWIDDFEALEANYEKWVAEAQRRIIEMEMLRTRVMRKKIEDQEKSGTALPAASSDLHPILEDQSEVKVQASDDDESSGLSSNANVAHRDAPAVNGALNIALAKSEETPVKASPALLPAVGIEPGHQTAGKSSELVPTTQSSPPEPESGASKTDSARVRSPSISSLTSSSFSPSSSPNTVITTDESPSFRPQSRGRSARGGTARPPLNATMPRRRPRESLNPQWPPSAFRTSTTQGDNNSYDEAPRHPGAGATELDRQISDILTSIPGHIRLTSSSSPTETAESRHNRVISASRALHSLRSQRSFTKTPELTLSAARPDENAPFSRRRNAGDSEIKVYHLTTPNRDKPIKLFVRRVGENGERVMVRVGGGWADLGEYLRTYAEHHGHRTVSDSKFEVLGLKPPGDPSPVPRSRSTTPRPPSAQSVRSGRYRSKTPTARSRPVTPAARAPSASPRAGSGSATSATSKTSWQGEEVGLAGPASRKLDLPEEKLEWIEEMMDQARRLSIGGSGSLGDRGSAEKPTSSAVGAGGFRDMGKIGGTKRVFLRGKGAENEA